MAKMIDKLSAGNQLEANRCGLLPVKTSGRSQRPCGLRGEAR
jgi:hypothetical protein